MTKPASTKIRIGDDMTAEERRLVVDYWRFFSSVSKAERTPRVQYLLGEIRNEVIELSATGFYPAPSE